MDGLFSQLPYKRHLGKVTLMGDWLTIFPQLALLSTHQAVAKHAGSRHAAGAVLPPNPEDNQGRM